MPRKHKLREVCQCLKRFIKSSASTEPKHELTDPCWVQKNLPQIDPEAAFTVSFWDSVSVRLYHAVTLGASAAAKLLPVGRVINELVRELL